MRVLSITSILATIITILVSYTSFAQVWVWKTPSTAPNGSMGNYFMPFTIDKNGNTFAAVQLSDTSTFHFGPYSPVGVSTAITSTDSDGNYRWLLCSNPTCDFAPTAICSDHAGNIYCFGSSDHTVAIGADSLPISGWQDFCIKISGSGHIIWLKKIAANAFIKTVTIDSSDNIYIGGDFSTDTINLSGISLTNTYPSYTDAFVAKLDTAANAIWALRIGGNNSETALSIKTTIMGEVVIAGSFKSPVVTFGTTTLTALAGSNNYYMTRLDASGHYLWTRKIMHTPSGDLGALTADTWGNTYVAGYYADSAVLNAVTLRGRFGMYIAKYDYNGAVIWGRTWGYAPLSSNHVHAMATDGCGNLWISGRGGGRGYTDIVVCGFDSSGNLVDSNYVRSLAHWSFNGFVNNIAAGDSGALYFAGMYASDGFVFGTDTVSYPAISLSGALLFAKYRYPFCSLITLNVSHPDVQSIDIYPNPTHDKLTIIPANQLKNAQIINLTGSVIANYILSSANNSIDISDVAPGIYLIHIKSNDGSEVIRKLVIQ